jgi:Sec-independent protein translocase protein TatA
VLGPKRLHGVLADVAKARVRFEEASRGFKSQLEAELSSEHHDAKADLPEDRAFDN